MESRPFKDHRQGTGWELALQHGDRVQADSGAVAGVVRVQVRGRMIVEEHPDHDAEEAADLRHGRDGCVVREKGLPVFCPLP